MANGRILVKDRGHPRSLQISETVEGHAAMPSANHVPQLLGVKREPKYSWVLANVCMR